MRLWQSDPIGDLLTLVQIKRYARRNPVKLEAVAALDSHVNRQGAHRGLFITSSRFLRGVQKFATPESRIILADSNDLTRWCCDSAQEMVAARNRAMALTEIEPLLARIRAKGTDPRLVVGGLAYPSFCLVLKESRTSALLTCLPSKIVSGDWQWGTAMPVLSQGITSSSEAQELVFRAIRKDVNGKVSYWGQRELYHVWDGRPIQFDHLD